MFIERPWGGYEIVYACRGGAVKILTIDPGCRLALQKHSMRAETWRLVAGELLATIDGRTIDMEIGKPVFVDVGKVHRLANMGTEVARVVEIIEGVYDEEDIERLEDDYGRD